MSTSMGATPATGATTTVAAFGGLHTDRSHKGAFAGTTKNDE